MKSLMTMLFVSAMTLATQAQIQKEQAKPICTDWVYAGDGTLVSTSTNGKDTWTHQYKLPTSPILLNNAMVYTSLEIIAQASEIEVKKERLCGSWSDWHPLTNGCMIRSGWCVDIAENGIPSWPYIESESRCGGSTPE